MNNNNNDDDELYREAVEHLKSDDCWVWNDKMTEDRFDDILSKYAKSTSKSKNKGQLGLLLELGPPPKPHKPSGRRPYARKRGEHWDLASPERDFLRYRKNMGKKPKTRSGCHILRLYEELNKAEHLVENPFELATPIGKTATLSEKNMNTVVKAKSPLQALEKYAKVFSEILMEDDLPLGPEHMFSAMFDKLKEVNEKAGKRLKGIIVAPFRWLEEKTSTTTAVGLHVLVAVGICIGIGALFSDPEEQSKNKEEENYIPTSEGEQQNGNGIPKSLINRFHQEDLTVPVETVKIEVFSNPIGGRYRIRQVFGTNHKKGLIAADEVSLGAIHNVPIGGYRIEFEIRQGLCFPRISVNNVVVQTVTEAGWVIASIFPYQMKSGTVRVEAKYQLEEPGKVGLRVTSPYSRDAIDFTLSSDWTDEDGRSRIELDDDMPECNYRRASDGLPLPLECQFEGLPKGKYRVVFSKAREEQRVTYQINGKQKTTIRPSENGYEIPLQLSVCANHLDVDYSWGRQTISIKLGSNLEDAEFELRGPASEYLFRSTRFSDCNFCEAEGCFCNTQSLPGRISAVFMKEDGYKGPKIYLNGEILATVRERKNWVEVTIDSNLINRTTNNGSGRSWNDFEIFVKYEFVEF